MRRVCAAMEQRSRGRAWLAAREHLSNSLAAAVRVHNPRDRSSHADGGGAVLSSKGRCHLVNDMVE